MEYTTQNAASLLGISPEELLTWSEQLAVALNNSAYQMRGSQRYYTEADIVDLPQVKALLASEYTYEQIRGQFSTQRPSNSSDRSVQDQIPALLAQASVGSTRETQVLSPISGAQRIERITLGDHSWERQHDGTGAEREAQEGIADQLNIFLPHTDTITNTEMDIGTQANRAALVQR